MHAALRRVLTRSFYRHRGVREAASLARKLAGRRTDPDVAHLTFYDDRALGPLQRDEALMLHGLVRVVRPRTVVEIGFLRGHSAFNFLTALDEDARLYSFDIKPVCAERARERFGHDPRLVYRERSQSELTPEDIDGRLAEFVFLDASHDLDLNKATFARLLPMLAPRAILAIHDTGSIPRRLLEPLDHWALYSPDGWVEDHREVNAGERAFVNWLLAEHPEFAQLHLHSENAIRCGITLVQRSAPLPRPEVPLGPYSSGALSTTTVEPR